MCASAAPGVVISRIQSPRAWMLYLSQGHNTQGGRHGCTLKKKHINSPSIAKQNGVQGHTVTLNAHTQSH